MTKVLLLLAVFTGGQWEPIAEPRQMDSVQACTDAAKEFLANVQADAHLLDDDTPAVGASCSLSLAK
jgi:hypothetical protein